jgi:NitT/TauT family transport system ATP-binding protein
MNENINLSVNSLNKFYSNKEQRLHVIKDIDLDVKKGEFISIFGPNGCGKTTFLNLIAGIDSPTSGSIILKGDGQIRSRVSIVFQDYDKSLMPWKNCLNNIFFPIECNDKLSKRDKVDKATSILELLGIKDKLPLKNYPYQMSGGQKQLTCIARSLITEPDVVLFDEPFASLDFQTRMEMVAIVEKIWLKTKKTIIFISHDIEEAIHLADRLILLTPRPASIKHQYLITIERPRSFEIESSKEFIDLKNNILREFTEMVRK